MLTEAGIATAPGTDFDHYRGKDYTVSFADTQTMAEASARQKDWMSVKRQAFARALFS